MSSEDVEARNGMGAIDGIESVVDLWSFRPVHVQSPEMVADRLRAKLWAYRAGEQLPPGPELARQLAVESNIVHQGLTILQSEGLVNYDLGVARVQLRPAFRGLVHSLDPVARSQLQQELPEVEAILRRRATIEARIASLAADKRETKHLQILGASLREMEAASSALQEFLLHNEECTETAKREGENAAWEYRRQDWIFHLTLADAAGVQELYSEVEILRMQFFSYIDPAWYRWLDQQDSVNEHREILYAVHAGKAYDAAAAMKRHLSVTKKSLRRHIRQTARAAN